MDAHSCSERSISSGGVGLSRRRDAPSSTQVTNLKSLPFRWDGDAARSRWRASRGTMPRMAILTLRRRRSSGVSSRNGGLL
jgi:hypothetical protein